MNGDGWHRRVDCNLCGSGESAELFRAARSGRRVVRCRRCGLVYYDPQPSREQLSALYSPAYFTAEFPPESRLSEQDRARRSLARIEREVARGRLIDVGCGVGTFLAVAQERGWTVAGLEPAPAALAVAAGGVRGPILEGGLERSRPEGIEPFDVLSMWNVLEHLSDPVGDLARAGTWLRPGGLIVVQTQNADSVTFGWMRRRWEQFVDPHLFHFSARTLRVALGRAGFVGIQIEGSAEFLEERRPPPRTVADRMRRVRDHLLVVAGWDPFNIMVAMARSRG